MLLAFFREKDSRLFGCFLVPELSQVAAQQRQYDHLSHCSETEKLCDASELSMDEIWAFEEI